MIKFQKHPLADSKHYLNKTFEEVMSMDNLSFRQWCTEVRKFCRDIWDNEGKQPKVGYSETDAIQQFQDLVTYPAHELEVLPGVYRNTTILGNAIGEYFPTMMKTKITLSQNGVPKSIYDFFNDDDKLESWITCASRQIKRDSFYAWSTPISVDDILEIGPKTHIVTTPEDFITWFETEIRDQYPWDYWFCYVKEGKTYSGFNPELQIKSGKNIKVTLDWINSSGAPDITKGNLDSARNTYSIRLYKKGQKVFPLGMKGWRVSFVNYAVNFPPLTARWLYEKYTAPFKDQDRIVIYDPSMGWAGRILGAMAVDVNRNIHYVGTDPNTDHNTTPGRTKYHEVADYFNEHIRNKGLFPKKHTYECFQDGSEVIGNNPAFQKYKGKIDLIFTSPPYFSKEVYSADPSQSCNAYGSSYELWREQFLRPTLKTCVEYLKSDRYILWNIADVIVSGKTLPLEKDSCDILKELGMEYVTTLKMTMAQLPGANRMTPTGQTEIKEVENIWGKEEIEVSMTEGNMKNMVDIPRKSGGSITVKYEPIFLFRKPVK